MINLSVISGFVGNVESQQKCVRLSLAVNYSVKGDDGNYKQTTDWIDCVCFDNVAEYATKNITKGQYVTVQGHLRTSTYTAEGESKPRKQVSVVVDKFDIAPAKKSNE